MKKSTKGIWLSVLITGIFTIVIGLLILGAPLLVKGNIRTMVAIMENNQEKDGSISIPKVLVPYMNGQKKIERK